jgi:hypothetical protein
MVIGKPLPFVRAFVDTVDEAIAAHSPRQRMSALHRTGLAFCVTAILVTNAICGARFERASLGAYALAALSWMFRHAKIPWEHLLVASVRVIFASYGITGGSLVIDDTDKQRSKVATTLAYLYKRRDQESGEYIWGQSLVLLVLVTQTITIPLGLAFYPPASELSAWYKQDKRRKQQGIPPKQRPPKPPSNPQYPTKQELALRLRRQCKAHHPTLRVSCLVADALYGAATFVEAASAIFGGVQVIRQRRSNQQVRLYKHAQYVADYCATHPGTLQHIRIRGGEEISVLVGSARMYVCARHTKRLIIALPYEGEDSYRYLLASDLTWRTLDIVQGYPLRWLVEVFVQDWKSHEGWKPLTKQPGHEGACRSVILSLLVDHCLFLHPDQHAHLRTNLPAYTVGSLRANVQVECLVDVIQHLIASEDPQSQLHRFTQALREVFAFSRSTTHLIQRQLGRLEPTPYLQYRADEVMRNVQLLST